MIPKDTVVVTGGTRGLGLAIAKRLCNDGFGIIAVGRSSTDQLQALIDQSEDRVVFEKFDFNEISSIKTFARQLVTRYGAIYGLVNNAALGHDGILSTMHETEISALIRVNIEAPIVLTKYLSRSMLIAQRGRIVNVGSITASTGFNGLSVYGATKSALAGFTRSLARELGKACITVNTVAPGYMETSMSSDLHEDSLETIKRRSPMNTLVEVDDAAAAVSYLMSNNAAKVTGTTLTVDAGSTA
jgi:3-oxoacyl-[acyl-carrier protein] reductase